MEEREKTRRGEGFIRFIPILSHGQCAHAPSIEDLADASYVRTGPFFGILLPIERKGESRLWFSPRGLGRGDSRVGVSWLRGYAWQRTC